MNEIPIFVNESNFYHLIRAIRENVASFTQQLDLGYPIKRSDVAVVIGNDEALKMLGHYTMADTECLATWVHSEKSWEEVKKEIKLKV